MKALVIIFMIWIAVLTHYVYSQKQDIKDLNSKLHELHRKTVLDQDDIIRLIRRTNWLRKQLDEKQNVLIQLKNQIRRRY